MKNKKLYEVEINEAEIEWQLKVRSQILSELSGFNISNFRITFFK